MRCDPPIRDILSAAANERRLAFGPSLRGSGGLHDGLALAILAASMRRKADGRVLRYVSGHVQRERVEGAASWVAARAVVDVEPTVAATAIFAAPTSAHGYSTSDAVRPCATRRFVKIPVAERRPTYAMHGRTR